MSLTVKKMTELNNEKRELLTPENKEYYENLLVYIRSNTLFRDEKSTEEILLEMLDHLLEAQKEGKSAEEVFGKTPKELADEISQTLPKEPIKNVIEFTFEILLILFGWFLVPVGIFTYFMDKAVEVHLISALVYVFTLVFLFAFFVFIVLRVLKRSAFTDEKGKKSQLLIWGFLSGIVVFLVVFAAFKYIGDFGPKIKVSNYTILGLGCFFLLASYLLKKMRESN